MKCHFKVLFLMCQIFKQQNWQLHTWVNFKNYLFCEIQVLFIDKYIFADNALIIRVNNRHIFTLHGKNNISLMTTKVSGIKMLNIAILKLERTRMHSSTMALSAGGGCLPWGGSYLTTDIPR